MLTRTTAISSALLLVLTITLPADEPDLGHLLLESGEPATANQAGLDMPTVSEPAPVSAGLHERLEALDKREVTYSLYIPEAVATTHAEDEAYRAPSLIVQNPGGRPLRDVKRYLDWADRRGVILVGIDRVSNDMPQHDKPRIQDAVLADLDARGVPHHPHLRYTIGMSGGAADGERMARRQPHRFAGIVLQGAGGVPKGDNASHLAIAILAGAKDPIFQGIDKRVDLANRRGNPLRVNIDPELAHDWFPQEEQEAALDWMLGLTKLTNPHLSDAERAAYREAAREEMAELSRTDSAAAKLAVAPELLRLEPLRDTPEYRRLAEAWATAAEEFAEKIDQPAMRHAYLASFLAGHEPHGGVQERIPPDIRERIKAEVARLRTDPAVVEDWKQRTAYREARELETRAGLDEAAITRAIAAYERVAESGSGTMFGERAAADAVRLRKIVEK